MYPPKKAVDTFVIAHYAQNVIYNAKVTPYTRESFFVFTMCRYECIYMRVYACMYVGYDAKGRSYKRDAFTVCRFVCMCVCMHVCMSHTLLKARLVKQMLFSLCVGMYVCMCMHVCMPSTMLKARLIKHIHIYIYIYILYTFTAFTCFYVM
jgi:hypothetical protein